MPNSSNMDSPITMIGLGRSGTSLIQDAFARHPEFQVCGETGAMIFGVWESAKATYMPVPAPHWQDFEKDPAAKPRYYLREVLQALCPSDKPRWFHKPAGLPNHLDLHVVGGRRAPLSGFPVEWYWEVLRSAFPNGKLVTALRNPFDVLVSRKDHSNWQPAQFIKAIIATYEVFEFGWDYFDHVVDFDELVSDFPREIERLCVATGVDYTPEMNGAKAVEHAPVLGRKFKASHADRWRELKQVTLSKAELGVIQSIWEKRGMSLRVPSNITVD